MRAVEPGLDGDVMGCCGKIRGAVKMLRSEAGIGIALPQLTAARRKACEACSDWDHGRCMAPGVDGKPCKCFTWAKTRLPKETCPAGRWPSGGDADLLGTAGRGEADAPRDGDTA